MAINPKEMKQSIILVIFGLIAIIGFSQPPKELYRGRLKEGDNYGNPYTMFVKDPDFHLDSAIVKVVGQITNGQPININLNGPGQIYNSLYHYALRNDLKPCAIDFVGCTHANWVKANAVIYLIKLQPTIVSNNIVTFYPMSPDSINFFGNRASIGLSELNPKVKACILGGDNCSNIRNRAQELIQYLQAYDLLKAGGKLSPYDQDKMDYSWTPRNKLREFSKELYVESSKIINSETGWKKNHGIICASALGMAAIVLNDAGVVKSVDNGLVRFLHTIWNAITLQPIPHPNYSPVNWWERAYGRPHNIICFEDCEDGLYDNFFIGQHNVGKETPMTSPDGKAGYAEGPGYFLDLSHTFFPFLRTADNYLSTAHPKNLIKQDKYLNMLKWYQEMLISNSFIISYDNSANVNGNLFGVLGMNDFPGNPTCVMQSNVDLRGDFLLALGASTGSIQKTEDHYSVESGNLIVRTSNKESNHTFSMLAEKDFAVDKEATKVDDTHDDDDMGSFTIYAGQKNKNTNYLAIDPPYFGWGDDEADETNRYWMHNTIEIDDGFEAKTRHYGYPNFILKNNGSIGVFKEFDLFFHFSSEQANLLPLGTLKRNVITVNEDGNIIISLMII